VYGDGDGYSVARFGGVVEGGVIGSVGSRGVRVIEEETGEWLHFEEDTVTGFRSEEFGGGFGAEEAYVLLQVALISKSWYRQGGFPFHNKVARRVHQFAPGIIWPERVGDSGADIITVAFESDSDRVVVDQLRSKLDASGQVFPKLTARPLESSDDWRYRGRILGVALSG